MIKTNEVNISKMAKKLESEYVYRRLEIPFEE